MRIKVAGLMKSPVSTLNTYRISETIKLEGDGSCQLQGDADLVRTREGVMVAASFRVRAPLLCSRCLDRFEIDLDLDVKEEFFPISSITAPLDPGEEAFTITAEQELDLG